MGNDKGRREAVEAVLANKQRQHTVAKHLHQSHEERLRMKIEDILLEDILLEAATNQIMKRELRLKDDSHCGEHGERLAGGECNDACSSKQVCMPNPDDS